jgi:hypothetical protein
MLTGPNGGWIVAIEFSPGLLEALKSSPPPARPTPLDVPPRKSAAHKQEAPGATNSKGLHQRNSVSGSQRGRTRKSGR